MSCGCGNTQCQGNCGCASNVTCPETILTPACSVRPCSPLANCGILPSQPTPYYAESGQCQENHCEQILQVYYASAICTNYAFNIPACGNQATLYFNDLKVLPVGAYLWHADYGYFEIVAFNNQTGQVVIINNCDEENAAPGTAVPACTCFIVTATPTDVALIGASCVAVDFTAPAVSDCIDITVTNVNGLEVGGQVAIGSGVYLLAAIVTPFIINICNEGSGITPGTAVIAKDANGNFQYCLAVISVNPCGKDAVDTGTVMVCYEDTIFPLSGNNAGDLLVLQNPSGDAAAYVDPCDAVQVCLDALEETLHCEAKTSIVAVTARQYTQNFILQSGVEDYYAASNTTIDSNIIQIDVPSDCPGNYLVEAMMSLAGANTLGRASVAIAPFDETEVRLWTIDYFGLCFYNEFQIRWNANSGGENTSGKLIWNSNPANTRTLGSLPAARSLHAQLGLGATGFGYAECFAYDAAVVAAGGSVVLEALFNGVTSTYTPSASFTVSSASAKLQLGGVIRVTKI